MGGGNSKPVTSSSDLPLRRPMSLLRVTFVTYRITSLPESDHFLSLYCIFLTSFEESDNGFRLVKYDHQLFLLKFHFNQSFLLWSALLKAVFSITMKNKILPRSGNEKF